MSAKSDQWLPRYGDFIQNGSKKAVEPVLFKCKFDPLHAGCWKKVFNEKVP